MASKQLFPHISRIITAARYLVRRYAPFFILIGFIILGILNGYLYAMLPPQVKNSVTMAHLLTGPIGAQTRADVYAALREAGKTDVVQDDITARTIISKEIEQVSKVVIAHPAYPDAYAYLALLELKSGSCERAIELINQARGLDANRKEFRDIEKYIENKCQITNDK